MVSKQAVFTANSPKPRPQLSQAIISNGMVYCSGQLGVDPKTSKLVEGTVQDRARQVLRNLSAVLEAAGTSLDNAVKVNIFLTSMDNFVAVNEVYDEFFTAAPKPCRTCVAVHQLPQGSDVEIELTASL
ncbi:Endoribonuclease L-PSP [Niveomyces insectorum RCEF 264]|uniref:Endoribonuclease L-PSP n=1 Tax=Niveomyces insectorum RCEF 264 TaxID=1081102 RepID=A0A167S4E9_9HYPO|nr:Endoribonuclease L-PSP [Niveomyces insectorum RCEF 264]